MAKCLSAPKRLADKIAWVNKGKGMGGCSRKHKQNSQARPGAMPTRARGCARSGGDRTRLRPFQSAVVFVDRAFSQATVSADFDQGWQTKSRF